LGVKQYFVHLFILLVRAIDVEFFQAVHVFLVGLFVLFPLCSVCYCKSVPCLIRVLRKWMCLYYYLLHVCVICTLFGTIALFDLCTIGEVQVF
jgi:hypothetical protein